MGLTDLIYWPRAPHCRNSHAVLRTELDGQESSNEGPLRNFQARWNKFCLHRHNIVQLSPAGTADALHTHSSPEDLTNYEGDGRGFGPFRPLRTSK